MERLDDRELGEFLDRIGAPRPPAPTLDALAGLQLAHLLAVPFENLDIHRGVEIVLDPSAIFDKVVRRGRGGYCYELNSNFGRLLLSLGFGVDMMSARVARDAGGFGPEHDHMALHVTVPGEPHPFLVDVGFGDAFTRPFPMVADAEQRDRDRVVRVHHRDDGTWSYDERPLDGNHPDWSPKYVFTPTPQALADFEAMNHEQQHAPDSHFRTNIVCSLLTDDGRITVSGDRLIETTVAGDRRETPLTFDDRRRVLRERFGVEFDGELTGPR